MKKNRKNSTMFENGVQTLPAKEQEFRLALDFIRDAGLDATTKFVAQNAITLMQFFREVAAETGVPFEKMDYLFVIDYIRSRTHWKKMPEDKARTGEQ